MGPHKISQGILCIMYYYINAIKMKKDLFASGLSEDTGKYFIHAARPIYWEHLRNAYA